LQILDPPQAALGVQRPGEEEVYDPVEAGDGMEIFRTWISGYFHHPSPWDGTLAKLDQHGNLGRKASVSTWTDAETKRWISNSGIESDSMVL
jgi:hypothetical protein